MPGLQAAKEPGVHLRIHRLANLAMVLATLQKERVPHLEKILADEVRLIIRLDLFLIEYLSNLTKISTDTETQILSEGGSWSSWINAGSSLGDGETSKQQVGARRLHLDLY